MATIQDYLNLIMQYESYGGQNVPNYRFDPTHTAQGYYQITNKNWLAIAPQLGIDTSVYKTAMDAPQDVQAQVAAYLLTQTPAGIANWANYNPQLNAALNAAGLQTSGPVSDSAAISAPAGDGPLIDLSGAAATQSTADILSSLALPDLSQYGISPTMEIVMGLGLLGAVGLYLANR
jgi:hypothetical protein